MRKFFKFGRKNDGIEIIPNQETGRKPTLEELVEKSRNRANNKTKEFLADEIKQRLFDEYGL